MGRRLVQRLTLRQLNQLAALQSAGHGAGAIVRAAAKLDDPRLVKVTASSALLCSSGLSR